MSFDSQIVIPPSFIALFVPEGKTRPEHTGPMTVSMLRGQHGHQAKEVRRLVAWMEQQGRPDVIVLSNSLLVGLAAPLREALGVPVVCTVQGELHFVDALGGPWPAAAWPGIASRPKR